MRVFLKFLFSAALFILSLYFLSSLSWKEAFHYLSSLPIETLLTCLILGILGHLCLAFLDVVSFKILNPGLSNFQVGMRSFVSYSFSMNLGTFVGAIGMRIKLYLELGESKRHIFNTAAQSTLSNWLAFLTLLECNLILNEKWIRDRFKIESQLIEASVFVLGLLILMIFCSLAKKRKTKFFHTSFQFYGLRSQLLLFVVALTQWMIQVLILKLLIQDSFLHLMSALFFSSLITLASHIPGGAGLLELSFIQILSNFPKEKLLGAVLGYRFFFLNVPFFIGFFIYIFTRLSIRSKKSAKKVRKINQ